MSSLRDCHAGKVAYATVEAARPGDARTAWSSDDDEREQKPRVPIIGVDPGAIPGSQPGGELGAAAYLERCGKDILRGHLKRTRRRDHR